MEEYTDDAPEYEVTCPSNRKFCDWKGDIKECKRSVHTDFGKWEVSFICPTCGGSLASINNNTPLNHPLQPFTQLAHHGGYLLKLTV